MKYTVSEHGRLDYLVNNGGGQFMSPLSDMSTKGWNAVIDTNLNGTYYCFKHGKSAPPSLDPVIFFVNFRLHLNKFRLTPKVVYFYRFLATFTQSCLHICSCFIVMWLFSSILVPGELFLIIFKGMC